MSSLNVALNVEAVGLRDEVKRINKMLNNITAQVSVDADKRSLTAMASTLSKAMSDATSQGMAKGVAGVASTIQTSMGKSLSEAFKNAKGDIRKMMEEAGKKGASAFFDNWDKNMPKLEEGAEKVAGKIRGALSINAEQLVGGLVKGLGGLTRQMGKALSKPGDALLKKYKDVKFGDAGAMGKTAKISGTVLSTLGRAASTIGVLVGGLSQLVGLMMDADSQAKQFNKDILSGGTAIGDITTGVTGIGDALDTVRGSAVDFAYNLRMGVTAKEVIAVQGAFNQMGYTYKEMIGEAKTTAEAQTNLQEATSKAVTVARTLGLEYSQAAETMATMMEETGGDIDYVSERLMAVSQAANMAGFGTKRFYGIMQNATAGIQMYNVRVEEAAGLLLTMSKILGATTAGNMLESFKKGFSEESYLDRLKRVKVTGGKATAEILENTIEDTARDLQAKIGDKMGSIQGAADSVLATSGKPGEKAPEIDFSQLESDPMKVAKQIAALDAKTQNKMLAAIRGEDSELAIQMEKFVQLSEGTKGGAANQAVGIGALDAGGTLAMKIAHAEKILGKSIGEMERHDYAVFENITGEGRDLVKLAKGLKGQYDLLKDTADSTAAEYEGMTKSEVQKEQLEQIEKYGAYVNRLGEVVTAQTEYNEKGELTFVQEDERERKETVLENERDYYQSQGDTLALATEESRSRADVISQQISDNTLEMSTILEMGVQAVLEQIYGLLKPFTSTMIRIMGMIPGIKGDVEEAQAIEAERAMHMDRTGEELREIQTRKKELKGEKSEIERQMAEASGEEKVDLARKLKAVDVKLEVESLKETDMREKRSRLKKATNRAEIRDIGDDYSDVLGMRRDTRKKAIFGKDGEGGLISKENQDEFERQAKENAGVRLNVGELQAQFRLEKEKAEEIGGEEMTKHAETMGLAVKMLDKMIAEGKVDETTIVAAAGLTTKEKEAGVVSLEEQTAREKEGNLHYQMSGFYKNAENELAAQYDTAFSWLTGENLMNPEDVKSEEEYMEMQTRTGRGSMAEGRGKEEEVGVLSDVAVAATRQGSGGQGGTQKEKDIVGAFEGMQAVLEQEHQENLRAIENNHNVDGKERHKQWKEEEKRHKNAMKNMKDMFDIQAQDLIKDRKLDHVEAIMEAEKRSKLQAMLQFLGEDPDDLSSYKDRYGDLLSGRDLMAKLESKTGKSLQGTQEGLDILTHFGAAFAESNMERDDVSYKVRSAAANDFIYRSTGEVQYFNSQDDIMGAKMGGAFHEISKNMSRDSADLRQIPSGMGMQEKGGAPTASNNSLSFKIVESENPEATARAVKKILMDVGLV